MWTRTWCELAQEIERTAILFLRELVVPGSRSVGADLLEFAAPGIPERQLQRM